MKTPELKFSEFNGEWRTSTFDEIFTIIDGDRGKNYPNPNDFIEDGYCLFLNAKNVTKNGFSLLNKMFIDKTKDDSMTKGKLIRNDLVLTTRGTVGNIAYYSREIPYENIRINSGMLILRSKTTDPFYNYVYMKSNSFSKSVKFTTFGSAQPQLTVKDLKKMKISFPIELKEQKKIASFIMLLNQKIEKQQEKVELLKRQKKGLMQKIFSQELRFKDENGQEYPDWVNKKLDEVALITMGQSPYSTNYSEDSEDTLLIQGNADLKNYKFNPRIYTSQITKLCEINDVIMTVRAPVGMLAIATQRACLGRGVCSLSTDKFVFHYLDYFNEKDGWSKFSQGSTFESINSNQLKDLNLNYPCTEERSKITKILECMNDKIIGESKKLENLNSQKEAFMQQMFI